jgi:hypothetical protein
MVDHYVANHKPHVGEIRAFFPEKEAEKYP